MCFRLLDRNPNNRLGANGLSDLQNHGFVSHLDWEKLKNKQLSSPFMPQVSEDTSDETIALSHTLSDPVLNFRFAFSQFSYTYDNAIV